jgi:hypothetical protein
MMYRVTLEALLCVLDFDLPDELLPEAIAEQYRRLCGLDV